MSGQAHLNHTLTVIGNPRRGRRRSRYCAAPAAAVLAVALLGVAPGAQPARAATTDVVVAAAGDIIGTCTTTNPPCDYTRVSDVILASGATTVLALGDISNNSGSTADYATRFQTSWGRFKDAIAPVPGNHDYGTAKAANYFSYFGAAAHGPSGYYSFDVGNWHIVALNSNCSQVGGCQSGSAQETWLRSDLAASSRPCTLAFWHHPRYSSGYGGDNTAVADLFADLYAARADVVLSGHSHDYERFAPQNASGGLDTASGVRQFVVGTGGAFFTGFSAVKANSQARQNTAMGALRLGLHAGSYDWAFLPIAGAGYSDTGTTTCHRAGSTDTTPPSTPGSVHTTSVTAASVALAWSASSDNVGVSGYRVYRDGSLRTTLGATTTAWTDATVSGGTTYAYQVAAVDGAGNESARAGLTVTTPAGRTLTFAPTDDATVDQANPATNYGRATRLTADHSPVDDVLIRFAVSGLNGCHVSRASLRLTVGSTASDTSAKGGDVHGAAATAWSQSTVTWNTAPAASAVVASLGAVSLGTSYEVPVTSLVAADGPVTIRVSNTSSDGARYYSTEGSTTAAPRLQVTCG